MILESLGKQNLEADIFKQYIQKLYHSRQTQPEAPKGIIASNPSWYRRYQPIQHEAAARDYWAALIMSLYSALPLAMPEETKAAQVSQQIQNQQPSAGSITPQVVKEVVQQSKPRQPLPATVEIVAKTIYGEAGGEGHLGRIAVASVIWNRAHGDPQQFANVCTKSSTITSKKTGQIVRDKNGQPVIVFQFDCWRVGINPDVTSGTWDYCVKLATVMTEKQFQPIFEAQNYYAFKGRNAIKCPRWARRAVENRQYRDIGNHRFIFL